MAVTGLSVAASGETLIVFLAGYGLAGGLANGIAYSLSLAQAARAAPQNPGWAMGLATAVYGLGSVIFAQVLSLLLAHMPVHLVVAVLAAILGTASLAATALLPGDTAPGTELSHSSAARLPPQRVAMLWVIYLLGASGGLMVIAHSAEIMAGRDGGASTMALAPTLVGLGSIAGGYLGGTMERSYPPDPALPCHSRQWLCLSRSSRSPGHN
jgi:MFS family permease